MMAILRRYPAGCALGLLLGSLALPALAEPPAGNNGLMTFPNVRVESAPAPAKPAKPAASAAQPALKAYRNPKTGELSESAPEEHSTLNHQAPLFSRSPRTATAASAASTTAIVPEIIYGPQNTQSVALDEESMVFQVVHKDANGKLVQECVTGESHARHALHSPKASSAPNNTAEGNRNDR
jgi:hypothetical protein